MAGDDQTDDSQKTEEPTQKRLDEARKKGQVPLSREVNNWVILLCATIMVAVVAPHLFSQVNEIASSYLEHAHQAPRGFEDVSALLRDGVLRVMAILALPFLILMVVAFFAPFLQVGPLFALESIKPSMDKISIVKGFGRLFSKRSLMEFLKGLLKICVVGVVGAVILYPYFGTLEHMIGLPLIVMMEELQMLVVRMLIGMLVVHIIIAVIDLSYQRMDHHKKMMMSRQEVREEYKQTEGDPHVRARLRQLRSEKARTRMMQNVPTADVVITNPTHYSIALKYDPDTMEAPLCVAKGIDEVALRIREVATEHDIMLYEDRPLARSLYDLVEVDEAIPYTQYKAVAEVISFVFKSRQNS
ncbi:MAG: flagellar biosynthesis protein FlhB [Micavibrio sp.]|nr:flagellar biosynthesis protein FlhB [Micavibrio sp.]|tara:strand:- start:2256 stop:3329 length:1074 start_codon:yes stop_codon:yes gene_type:complete